MIACGVQQPTAWKAWDPWDDAELPGGANVGAALRALYQMIGGLQAEIDTSSAGFRTTPDYFARIDGPRVIEAIVDGETVRAVVDGLLSVVDPTPSTFTAQVIVLYFPVAESDGDTGPTAAVRDRRRLIEGLDVSALTSVFAETGGQAPATAAIAEGEPDLPALLKDWQVGWMGVEG